MLTLHVAAVAFWFGILGGELVIERSRTESREHGYAVARNHFWIDVLFELPAALLVLATGLVLLTRTDVTPVLAVKIGAAILAVGLNAWCVVPVTQRKRAAAESRLADVIRHSRTIDRIGLVGIPAGALALALGVFLGTAA